MVTGDCIIPHCVTNYNAMLSYLISQNLWDFSFYIQSDKPTNTVNHQIPIITPVQNIAKTPKGLVLDIIRSKQISAKCLSCRGPLTSVKYKTTCLKLDWHSGLTVNIMAKYRSTGSSLLDVFGVGVAADMSNYNSYHWFADWHQTFAHKMKQVSAKVPGVKQWVCSKYWVNCPFPDGRLKTHISRVNQAQE
jgi:hypothetical protein